ncbi:MAG: flavin reductase family protein, partial [Eubacterium sp.]
MFKEISFTDVKENVVDLLKNQWGLVTAGDENALNTMTVSWGAVGELWAKDMVTIYIRPQRYTVKFLEEKDYFTLSF